MTKYILMALALGAFTGCDNGDTLSEQQTMQALTAVGSAAGLSFATLDNEVTATSGQVSVNSSATCPGGGTAAVNGQATVTGENNFRYSIDLSTTNCQVGTIIMNGGLESSGSINNQDITASLDGRITFTGGLTGTCVFNYDLSINPSGISYRGRACGRNINIEINQQP
jgi:hypothetical protein